MRHLPDPDLQPQFYAAVPAKRLLAWVIDILIVLGLCLIAVLLTAFVGLFFFGFLWLVIDICYRTVTIANGAGTLGMRFVGIELRDAEGARPSPGMAFAHTAGYVICISTFLLQAVSVVMMLTGARAQGLPDAFLGTVALNRRAVT